MVCSAEGRAYSPRSSIAVQGRLGSPANLVGEYRAGASAPAFRFCAPFQRILGGDGRFEVLVPRWWSRENIFDIALAIAGVLIPFLIIYIVLVD